MSIGISPYAAQTFSGEYVDAIEPKAETLKIIDLAVGLASGKRFNGQTHHQGRWVTYPIAAHATRGSIEIERVKPALCDRYPKLPLAFLLHEGDEGIVFPDIISPAGRALNKIAGRDIVTQFKNQHQREWHRKVGLPWPLPVEMADAIEHMDLTLLATEARDLKGNPPWAKDLPAPLHTPTVPISERAAAFVFLSRLIELTEGEIQAEAWEAHAQLTSETTRVAGDIVAHERALRLA